MKKAAREAKLYGDRLCQPIDGPYVSPEQFNGEGELLKFYKKDLKFEHDDKTKLEPIYVRSPTEVREH